MKRSLPASFGLFSALCCTSLVALAATATDDTLAPLIITASPVAQTPSRTMRSVTTISREDIEQSPADNLADLLAETDGVQIRRRGAPGVQADVSIRGANFEQTLILLDGIPISNPQSAHHNLNLPVPLSHVARIEIIKGPGAMQYGGGATAGVINVITRAPDKAEADATLTLGSHDTRQLDAFVSGRTTHTRHALSAGASHTDGEYADKPTDADIRRALYNGHAQFDQWRLQWGLGVSSKDFGAWGFYSDAYPDARERIKSRLAWGGAQFPLGDLQVRTRLYWRGHKDWFKTIIGQTGFVNRHDTDATGFKGNVRWHRFSGTTVIGTHLRHETIDSTALQDHNRNRVALRLFRHQALTDRLSAEVGLNRIDYSDYRNYWLPSAALSLTLNDDWHTFASWARSARVPSYTDLYLNTAANQGNPDLQPEITDAYELGIAGDTGAQRIKAAVFERRSDDLIDWARASGDKTFHADNFSGYRLRGAELSWQWSPRWRWLETLELGYEYQHVQLDAHGREVSYALHIPRQTWRARANIPLVARLHADITARRPDYRRQNTVTLLAAQLRWQARHVHASLAVHNLLDERIIETGFSPIPGRWFYAGIGVDF